MTAQRQTCHDKARSHGPENVRKQKDDEPIDIKKQRNLPQNKKG